MFTSFWENCRCNLSTMIEPYNPYLIPCKNAKRGVLLNIAEQFWKHVWHHF